MRYFPKSTTKESFTDNNNFLIKGTGKIYKGPYIETGDGEYYAGSHNSPGVQLIVNNTIFYKGMKEFLKIEAAYYLITKNINMGKN